MLNFPGYGSALRSFIDSVFTDAPVTYEREDVVSYRLHM